MKRNDAAGRARYIVPASDPTIYLLALESWQEPFPRHWHDEWGVALIEEGVNRFWYRGAWQNAGRGSIIVVHPGELHDGGLETRQPWAERMFYIPVATMESIGEAWMGRRQTLHFRDPVIQDEELAGELRSLYCMLVSETAADTLRASEKSLRVFGTLIERYASGLLLPRADGHDEGAIMAAVRFLQENPALRTTLPALAAQVGLSPYHFLREFARCVGVTPHAYLTQLRINHARRLLLEGSSISDAALASGFADQAHLTREFRRALAITPGRYLKARKRS